jgi:hypothetical protein
MKMVIFNRDIDTVCSDTQQHKIKHQGIHRISPSMIKVNRYM